MTIKIKPGATLHGLTPHMVLALSVANDVYRMNAADCWVTSGNDGKHKINSKHYCGNAIDLRTRTLIDPSAVHKEIQESLGIDYDVILEADHIHIEYDPKRPGASDG